MLTQIQNSFTADLPENIRQSSNQISDHSSNAHALRLKCGDIFNYYLISIKYLISTFQHKTRCTVQIHMIAPTF